MVDTNKLRGLIAERGLSQRKVAKELGMTEKTFYTKMKSGDFRSVEMDILVEFLKIDNPLDYFFANSVSH